MVERGHQVTVIAGNNELGLSLGRKRIGLLQVQGMAVIVLNPVHRLLGGRARPYAAARFARRAGSLGRKLPRPDLVLASSPPQAVSRPAYALSCFYGAPLVLEIRENAGAEPGLKDSPLKQVPFSNWRAAARACARAEAIITNGPGTAMLAAEFASPGRTIHILSDGLDFESLFEEFEGIVAPVLQDRNSLTAAAPEP